MVVLMQVMFISIMVQWSILEKVTLLQREVQMELKYVKVLVFMHERTLNSPFISLQPSNEWWNMEIINLVEKSISEEDILTILLTGRRKDLFHDRIVELCTLQNLLFDL